MRVSISSTRPPGALPVYQLSTSCRSVGTAGARPTMRARAWPRRHALTRADCPSSPVESVQTPPSSRTPHAHAELRPATAHAVCAAHWRAVRRGHSGACVPFSRTHRRRRRSDC
jgi:hypothetical protein